MAGPGLQNTESLHPSGNETGNEWSKEKQLRVGLFCPWHAVHQGLKIIQLLSWRKEMAHVWICSSGRERKYWKYTRSIAASSSHNDLGEKNIPVVMSPCDGVKQSSVSSAL